MRGAPGLPRARSPFVAIVTPLLGQRRRRSFNLALDPRLPLNSPERLSPLPDPRSTDCAEKQQSFQVLLRHGG